MNKLLALAAVPLMTACAGGAPQYVDLLSVGTTESQIVTKFGAPAERRQLPGGGYSVDYPQEPLGYQNWRINFSPDGRMVSREQLIDEAYFARLKPGMTRTEVMQTLGRHAEESAYPNLNESVLSWRYIEFGNRLMFFNAHFDGMDGREKFKYSSRTPDPVQQSVDSGG